MKKTITMSIILVLLLGVTQPIVGNVGIESESCESLDEGPVFEPKHPKEDIIKGESTTPAPIKTKQDSTTDPAKDGELFKVIVATTDVNELASLLSDCEFNGLIGTSSTNSRGIAFPILEVSSEALVEIEKLPNVLGVYNYEDPILNTDVDAFNEITGKMQSREPDGTTVNELSYNGATFYHGAETAWTNGFTGEGVKVATVSPGTDFGHFELAGRQAVVDDASSPYYNYPIAFDYTSMRSYLANGLAPGTVTPTDSWYTNTSSTDLHVYHTPLIDGTNDFWVESNPHGSSTAKYPLSLTSELRATDLTGDISDGELDLTSLYVTSDHSKWFFSFNVTPWPRTYNVSYALYIDADGIPSSGATTDPLGNYINTSLLHRPEFAIYLKHIGVDWGVAGPGDVWSKNDTIDNATFHSWNSTSTSWEDSIELQGIDGEQAFGGDFIEFSLPKEALANENNFSLMLFSVGDNTSHAQDSVPPDNNVSFAEPDWTSNYTTLTNFIFIETPPEYVVDGIPSQSGEYRIGLHPDRNLIENHYGRPVAVLLTDYYVAGNYDTIYVDLDNDKDFSDERPVQAYSAHNDTLNIGPNFGTERYDNGTIYHNSQYYTLYNKKFNEELIINADGRETEFRLQRRYIIDAPEIYLNSTTDTILTKSNYTLDAVNGIITLNEGLKSGDDLVVKNYTHRVAETIEFTAFINYTGMECDIELHDWIISKDLDADGGVGDGKPYPDVSGGMAYFIGDNSTPLPYSDIYCNRNGIGDNPIPGNGDLIAFFGEFDGGVQGTSSGSTICAQGAGMDGNDNVLVKGMAPGAKLIPIREGSPFDAWYFAVEGYDGIVGNSDNAQIVAMTTDYPVQETGWDIYSRAVDYISMIYAQGKTIFVAGVGDRGFGYGSASSPGSSEAVITAGIGTQFYYRNYNPHAPVDLFRYYADGGPNSNQGEILPSSGRGPNMLGQPEPDVITAGAFLFGSTPLNVDMNLATPSVFNWFGGQWAWDLWSGPALSSSSTAGMLALIYDAYYQVNGAYPDIEIARSLLRSGADNLNYDILSQGAGYTNADKSTKLAANMDGLYLNKTFWVPGGYRGERYEAFAKLLYPDDTVNQTFTIENRNQGQDTTIEVYDEVFHKFGSYQISINSTKNYDVNDIPGVINIEPYIAIGTELLKVTICSEQKSTMRNYMGELFDWTDTNQDGKLDFPDEQNRIAYVIGTNILELRYRDPLGRVHDGLAVQIKGFGGTGEPLTEWTINLDFYNKTDWDWLDFEGAPPTTVAAGGTEAFTARMTIPNDAPIGSYEGSIYIKEKEPQEIIAAGVGIMMYNVSFKLWFHPATGAYGIINDNNTLSGNRAIIPKSSVVRWNGTFLYEGEDYELQGTGGSVKFSEQYPAGSEIPRYAPYFNITYLTVEADNGFPIEEATWTGQTSVPNLVRGDNSIVIKKDGVQWNQTEDFNDLNVTWATGGEMTAILPHKNIVRETIQLSKNSVEWPQFGGEASDAYITTPGQNTTDLAHGNIIPGSTEIYLNGEIMPQTGEVPLIAREEVQGLNSTSVQVENEMVTIDGTWAGKLAINGDDTPDFTITSYLIYEDGIPLIDGLDFIMHVDGVHGKFRLTQDPSGHSYTATYTYYNHTLQIGYLEHENIIFGSYTFYKNGLSMAQTQYVIAIQTGQLTLMNPLGPNEVIEAAYKWNVYVLDARIGKISFADEFVGGEQLIINYTFNNYMLDLSSGMLDFADPLNPGDKITANYSLANYIIDMAKGIVKFANPILPGVIVTCEYWHYETMIPVFINIAANSLPFTFGGNTSTFGHYDNNKVYGGGGDNGYSTYDSRFYFVDIPDTTEVGEGKKLLIDVNWTYTPSDIDVSVYGQGSSMPPWNDPERYGPYTLVYKGGSEATASSYTTTGTSREVVTAELTTGLNVIMLRNTVLNGSANYEEFSGTVGTMSIEPCPIDIVTNQLYDKRPLTIMSGIDWEGIDTEIYGSEVESYTNQEVWQDDTNWENYDSFQEQLSTGSTTIPITVNACSRFNVHIWGHSDAPDLDLGIFLDGKDGNPNDGKTQVGEYVAMGADWDADEEVTLLSPDDGTYLIKIYGFTLITEPGHYDIQTTKISPLYASDFYVEDLDDGFLPANTSRTFNLTWDFLGSTPDGTYVVDLFVGPVGAARCCQNPINLLLDRVLPEIRDMQPIKNSTVNDTQPLISANYSDDFSGIDVQNVTMSIDGVDITAEAIIGNSSVTYIPAIPLDQGKYIVEVTVQDNAGNFNSTYWWFTVEEELSDTTSPDHSNEYPSIDGLSYNQTPIISVHVTDISGVNISSIMIYINGFSVAYNLSAISNGYNVSYWHGSGFSEGEVVTCRIVADDIYDNRLDFTWQFTVLTTFDIQLYEGWNLVSLPLIQSNESIETVLSSISGKWDYVQAYKATDPDHWKTYCIYKPGQLNDLLSLDHTMGFWINITEPNVTLRVQGTIPTSTGIPLYAGWNLVGYPTLNGTMTVANALWSTSADKVKVCNLSEPYHIKEVGPTYVMKPGEGYWVHVPVDTIWVVDW